MMIVTADRLASAYRDVRREIRRIGIWTPLMDELQVQLVPVGFALGWKWDGMYGHIDIPAISLCRLARRYFDLGPYRSLRHVLRHEFGHAYADLYRRALTHRGQFSRVFGGSYDDRRKAYPDPPCEKFADAFAVYIRQKGEVATLSGITDTEWEYTARFKHRLQMLG